jgi:hypothetical protein
LLRLFRKISESSFSTKSFPSAYVIIAFLIVILYNQHI